MPKNKKYMGNTNDNKLNPLNKKAISPPIKYVKKHAL
jgi:hypothetical protein